MQANQFGERGPSSFGDFAPFQIWPNFYFGTWTIVHGGQKIHASRV